MSYCCYCHYRDKGFALKFRRYQYPATNTTKTIQIVVAENFWGSLVSQIGGTHVKVLSIVSDPNADPHEYESNTENARAFAMADYIIVNGAGYDSWANKLIGAGAKQTAKF